MFHFSKFYIHPYSSTQNIDEEKTLQASKRLYILKLINEKSITYTAIEDK